MAALLQPAFEPGAEAPPAPDWLRPLATALSTYLALALVLAAPFLFFDQTLFLADVSYNAEPVARFMRQVWQQTGHCPVWNPYLLCGAPQIQVLWPVAYMPGYAFLLLPFGPATGVFLAAHFLIAGAGGYIWQFFGRPAEGHERRFLPAFLFGLVFMLCGYMTGCSINLGLLAAASFTPVLLFLIERAASAPSLWCLALLAFLFGQQVTAGRPEIVALASLLYLSYFLLLWFRKTGAAVDRHRSVRSAALVAVGLSGGFAFAAVDLLPMLELVSMAPSVGALSLFPVTYWSAGWFDFLSVFVSQPLGQLSMDRYGLYPTYPGDMPYITSLYLSAPVVTLALAGFLSKDWTHRWFWLAWGAGATIVSAGEFGGLLPVLARSFPDVIVFRFPIKASIFLLFALAVAAAKGWRSLARGTTSRRAARLIALGWGGVALFGTTLWLIPAVARATIAGATGDYQPDPDGWHRLPAELVVAGLTGLIPIVHLVTGKAGGGGLPPARTAVVLFVTGSLLLANGAAHLWRTADSSIYQKPSMLAQWLRGDASSDPSSFRVVSLLADPLPAPPAVTDLTGHEMEVAFMQYTRQVLKPNTNVDAGIRLSNGVSTIPSWNSFFLSTGLIPRSALGTQEHPAGRSDLPLLRWCQATSTRYVLTSCLRAGASGGPEEVPKLDPALFKLLREDLDWNIRLFEVPAPRPRFSLYKRFRVVPDRYTALKTINRADATGFDPRKEFLLVGGDAETELETRQAPDRSSPEGYVGVVSQRNDQLTLKVSTHEPAFLVVTDSWYPGWEARVDGTPTAVLMADGLERAVRVPEGTHEVVFVYKPRSLFWGSLISKFTLLALALLAAVGIWRRFAKSAGRRIGQPAVTKE